MVLFDFKKLRLDFAPVLLDLWNSRKKQRQSEEVSQGKEGKEERKW